MTDHSTMKLGRKAAKFNRKVPLFASFAMSLPAPPTVHTWTKLQSHWGMMLNDQLSCCTIAALGHAIQVTSLNAGTQITVPDSTILSKYERWCGYNPRDPSTDQGGSEEDVLAAWMKEPIDGHKLMARAAVNSKSDLDLKTSTWLFGQCYLGLDLPNTCQQQAVWDVVPNWQNDPDAAPNSWGGHAVIAVGYNERNYVIITWGVRKLVTPAFVRAYCSEAHAMMLDTWLQADRKTPSGFETTALLADMKGLG